MIALRISTLQSLIAVAAVMQLTSASLPACDLCCALCGKGEAQTKVCRLVCEEKKITVTCWSCTCEDFCLPGPSWPLCQQADIACPDDSDPCGHCHGRYHKLFLWSEWKPLTCPKLATKKRLQKKIVTKKVPSYTWVVEDLCQACEEQIEVTPVPKGVMIPPAPAIEGAVTIGFEEIPSPK